MAEYPITMKQKNDQGQYDTLYPQTLGSQIQGNIQSSQIEGDIPSSQISGSIPSSQITGQFPASQIDGIYTKNQTLTQSVAQLFGLSNINAIPDNVFEILSQAALYKTVTHTAQLGTLPEGSIIYLNENGSPVPFYVAKQGYEPDYNTNRVLVVRKAAAQTGAWNSSGVNTYDGSTIDTWMNGTYLQTLDSDVQTAIGQTYVQISGGSTTYVLSYVQKAVFALSLNELGRYSSSYARQEGSILPIASTLQQASFSAATVNQWTRSPYIQERTSANILTSRGSQDVSTVTSSTSNYYRPAFTLPADFTAYTDTPTTGLYDISDNLLLKLPGVQIETGSYVGTGTYGLSKPNSLTFGFEPKLVIIQSDQEISVASNGILPCVVNNAPSTGGISFETEYDGTILPYGIKVTRNQNTVSWYFSGNASTGPNYQLNYSGSNYYYFAIG